MRFGVQRIAGSAGAALRGVLAVVVLVAPGCEPDGGARDRVSGDDRVSASPVEAVDDVGRVVRLSGAAMRVVSLLPATTETIVALGAAGRLIARTDYDEDAAVADLPSVGGGLTPNLEVLASLRPDLVIAWEEAGTARVRPRLEALGIAVFAVATRDTAGIYANIERLGRLLGLEHRADSLALAMRQDLEEIRASLAGLRTPTVLYMVSLDPPMVAGPNLFIGEMIQVAGGANVFPELVAASPQVSLEEIVARRPEVILIPSAADSATVVGRLAGSPGWRELLNGGSTRVRVLPVDILHRPGPGIVDAARTLREALHPYTSHTP